MRDQPSPTSGPVTVASAEAGEDDPVAECQSDSSSSDDAREGPPGLAFLLGVTDDVVRASSLERLPEVRTCVEPAADGDGTSVSFHPYRIVVDDVVYHTPTGPGMAALPDWKVAGSALAAHDVVVLDYHTAEASWVTQAGVSPDLVGLQRLSGPLVEITGARFAITFLVEERPDGSWHFLDPVSGDEMTVQMGTVTSELGLDPWTVLHDFRSDIGRQNSGRSPSAVWETMYRVTGSDVAEPTWWDEDPALRPFTVDAAPVEALENAEAIGLEMDAGGVMAASAPVGASVAVTSASGVSHAFSAQVGSHVVVGLRENGEELAVVYVDPGGERTELGRITGVDSGEVAVVSFVWDDVASAPALGEVRSRPATEWELGMADGMGIRPDGSIDLDAAAAQR